MNDILSQSDFYNTKETSKKEQFFKIKNGINQIKIVGRIVAGWQSFIDKMPLRCLDKSRPLLLQKIYEMKVKGLGVSGKFEDKTFAEKALFESRLAETERIRRFIAFCLFDFSTDQFKICVLSQKTLIEQLREIHIQQGLLEDLVLVINKTQGLDKLDTTYDVVAGTEEYAKTEKLTEIKERSANLNYDIRELFNIDFPDLPNKGYPALVFPFESTN